MYWWKSFFLFYKLKRSTIYVGCWIKPRMKEKKKLYVNFDLCSLFFLKNSRSEKVVLMQKSFWTIVIDSLCDDFVFVLISKFSHVISALECFWTEKSSYLFVLVIRSYFCVCYCRWCFTQVNPLPTQVNPLNMYVRCACICINTCWSSYLLRFTSRSIYTRDERISWIKSQYLW